MKRNIISAANFLNNNNNRIAAAKPALRA